MTKLDIWNMALACLPHDRRITAEDDGSTEAMRCSDAWDLARLSVITSTNWGFLTREDSLCCGHRHHNRLFFFPRPASAVKVIGLYDRDGRKVRAHALNGGLSSDERVCSIRYLEDNEDYDSWPPWFLEAVVRELAYRIAGTVTGSLQHSSVHQQNAAIALAKAQKADSSEIRHDGTNGKTFFRARNMEVDT